jgi:hypothetical protein
MGSVLSSRAGFLGAFRLLALRVEGLGEVEGLGGVEGLAVFALFVLLRN